MKKYLYGHDLTVRVTGMEHEIRFCSKHIANSQWQISGQRHFYSFFFFLILHACTVQWIMNYM